MEPVAAPLPEFDRFGNHAIAAPEVGLRNLTVGELFFQFLEFREEHTTRGDNLALVGDPSPKAATLGPAQKILKGFGLADFFDWAGDFDLAGERDPRKKQGGMGVFGDLLGFAAAIVGEKDKTSVVEALQQNGSARNASTFVSGSKGHRIRFGNSRGAGFVEPLEELGDRVGIERVLFEWLVFIINAQAMNVGVGIHF